MRRVIPSSNDGGPLYCAAGGEGQPQHYAAEEVFVADAGEPHGVTPSEAVADYTLLSGIHAGFMRRSRLCCARVLGQGGQKAHSDTYRGAQYGLDVLPRTKIEIVASNRDCDDIVLALSRAARSGNIGDGKIFVYEITDVVRIRNGEIGEAAL